MAEVFLPQEIADGLIAMPKQRINDEITYLPRSGDKRILPLESNDHQERFTLDIYKGRINLSKLKYQNRGRLIVPLLRLDLVGPIHTNPDDTELPCPHFHIYKQGYGDRWAYYPPPEFTNLRNAWQSLQDFICYCNIIKPPCILRGAEDWDDK